MDRLIEFLMKAESLKETHPAATAFRGGLSHGGALLQTCMVPPGSYQLKLGPDLIEIEKQIATTKLRLIFYLRLRYLQYSHMHLYICTNGACTYF